MIEPDHPSRSVARQCELVSISRWGFCCQPAGETAENLALVRLIDAQFLETPLLAFHRLRRWNLGQLRPGMARAGWPGISGAIAARLAASGFGV